MLKLEFKKCWALPSPEFLAACWDPGPQHKCDLLQLEYQHSDTGLQSCDFLCDTSLASLSWQHKQKGKLICLGSNEWWHLVLWLTGCSGTAHARPCAVTPCVTLSELLWDGHGNALEPHIRVQLALVIELSSFSNAPSAVNLYLSVPWLPTCKGADRSRFNLPFFPVYIVKLLEACTVCTALAQWDLSWAVYCHINSNAD